MTKYIYLFWLLSTPYPTLGYKVDVILEDEGVLEELEFELTKSQVPPFETNPETDEGVRGMTSGPLVTGYFGNTRRKRSSPNEEVCVRNLGNEHDSTRTLVVEAGETFHLPCHPCGSHAGRKFESAQWIRLNPFPNAKGHYHVKEIISGMHEDDTRNRVVITLDHTLTVKRARSRDSGNYFCTKGLTEIVDTWLSWKDLQKWMVNYVHMKYYFHVDVLKLISDKMLDVSKYSATKPAQPKEFPDINIVVETSWHPWSECNVCGQEGLRKRIGICMVRKLKTNSAIPNGYLESLLKSTETRLPCHSQLFRQFADEEVLNRPNEVQIEECLIPCTSSHDSDRKRRAISKKDLLDERKKEKEEESQDKSVTEGDYLILVCPRSSITTSPVWMNGTENLPLMRLKKTTNSRIKFDPIGNLIFAPATLADSGTYSCWIKKKMAREFEVKVKVDVSAEAVEYGVMMGYVFLADFGLFVVLSVVKYMNRKVQVRRKGKKKDDVNDEPIEEKASLINETKSESSTGEPQKTEI